MNLIIFILIFSNIQMLIYGQLFIPLNLSILIYIFFDIVGDLDLTLSLVGVLEDLVLR